MSDLNPKVAALVERALKKNPDLRSAELQRRATKIDKRVEKLTGRQFHARYALQARRKLFGGKKSTTKVARRRGPPARQIVSDPAVALLTASYQERRAALQEAIDAAFQRAIEADSVQRINTLLSSIDRETKQFAGV